MRKKKKKGFFLIFVVVCVCVLRFVRYRSCMCVHVGVLCGVPFKSISTNSHMRWLLYTFFSFFLFPLHFFNHHHITHPTPTPASPHSFTCVSLGLN